MADLADLIQQLSFYQNGGVPQGQRSIDKVNTMFNTVGSAADDITKISKQRLEAKKISLENEKLANDNKPGWQIYGLPSPADVSTQEKAANDNIVRFQQGRDAFYKNNPRPFTAEAASEETNLKAEPQPQPFADPYKSYMDKGIDPRLTIGQNSVMSAAGLKQAQVRNINDQIQNRSVDVNSMISDLTGIPVGKIPKEQYDATLMALRLQAKTDPNKPLTPFQALILSVPFGTTAAQAQGIVPRSQADKEKITQLNGASLIVDKIADLSTKVNTFDNLFDRFSKGGTTAVEAWLQTNPDATQLAQQAAYLSNIIRALGEKGTLAEGDVQRAISAIPRVYPIPDSKETAIRKIQELKSVIGGAGDRYIQTITTPLRIGGAPGAAPAVTPPQQPPSPAPQQAPAQGGSVIKTGQGWVLRRK